MTSRSRDTEAYRGRTVVVTGGAGAIGANLVRALGACDPTAIVVIDDLSSGFRWNLPDLECLRFVHGSITDPAALERAFAEPPSVVFHLAAQFANQNSVDHPESDLHVNGLGTLRVLERAAAAGMARVVYAGSGCALAAEDGGGGEAGAPGQLTTPYQITKLLGEHYAAFFHRQRGLAVARPRLFNVYGPGEVPGPYRNVIPNFIDRALRGRPLRITGTGAETRDFCWVGDAVDAFMRAGVDDAAVGRAFHVASGREVAIADLAEKVLRATGADVPIEYVDRRSWDHRLRTCGDPTDARRILGLNPGTVSLDEGLARTVAWFRRHGARIRAATGVE